MLPRNTAPRLCMASMKAAFPLIMSIRRSIALPMAGMLPPPRREYSSWSSCILINHSSGTARSRHTQAGGAGPCESEMDRAVACAGGARAGGGGPVAPPRRGFLYPGPPCSCLRSSVAPPAPTELTPTEPPFEEVTTCAFGQREVSTEPRCKHELR